MKEATDKYNVMMKAQQDAAATAALAEGAVEGEGALAGKEPAAAAEGEATAAVRFCYVNTWHASCVRMLNFDVFAHAVGSLQTVDGSHAVTTRRRRMASNGCWKRGPVMFGGVVSSV